MSDNKTPAQSGVGNQENPLVPHVKDAAIFVGWIAGLVLIAGLCWFLTQPVRSKILSRAVNQVLEQSGNSYVLGGEVSPGALKPGVSKMGSWYTMVRSGQAGAEGTRAFIFVFIGEGTFFPCAARVAPDGKVEEFIPLSSYGEKVIKRVPSEILKLYARRIEGSEL